MINTLRNFGKNLVFGTIAAPILALTAFGHLADVVTTWYAITITGAREGNPLLAWFVNSNFKGKWAALTGLKALVVRGEAQACMKYKYDWPIKPMIFRLVFVWLVAAWNFSLILRRTYGRTSSKA
jgi:hypothetical protein